MIHQGEAFRDFLLSKKETRHISKAAQIASGEATNSPGWRKAKYRISEAIKMADLDDRPKIKAWIDEKFPEFLSSIQQTTIVGDGNINNSPNSISQVGNNITELERLRLENLELKQQNTALQQRLNDLTDQLLELTKKILK